MSKTETEKQQIVIFKIDNNHYGASIEQIREITRIGEISSIPNAPHYVLGVTNRRGQVTTVVDLRRILGMPDKEIDLHSRMLIIETKTTSKGIVVDAVEDATMLNKSDIEETPEIIKSIDDTSSFVRGIGKKDKKLIVLLNLKALTSDDKDDTVELQVNPEALQPAAAPTTPTTSTHKNRK
jgi:purine-binding chemotaxis protein CheW